MDQWVTQIRKGMFEVAILSLLQHKEMYGYEITTSLKKSAVFALSEGAVYPILRRMAKKGWIEFYWADSTDGPKRKYYRITREGKRLWKERMRKYKELYQALVVLGGGENESRS
jgi:PadR family transcriptional regulator PadR